MSDCGLNGISVNAQSVVRKNRAFQTGGSGISLSPSGIYSHNTVGFSGLGGGNEPNIAGGKASAGNFCDDGSCTSDGRRRFDMTKVGYVGSLADEPGVFDTGFHFASLSEIYDTAALRYDTVRGKLFADSGEGPPQVDAWVRTGNISSAGASAGSGNCLNWSRDDVTGTAVRPFGEGWLDPAPRTGIWRPVSTPCSAARFVMCVED